MSTYLRTFALPLVASTAVSLVACASTPEPTAKVATTSADIRAAQELQGDQIPSAQYYLKLANDQLAEANRLIKSGDNDKAASLLDRADSDAELAVALAREEKTKQAAMATQSQLQDLRRK